MPRARRVIVEDEMTPEELFFAEAYLIDRNGKWSAVRAGIPEKQASLWAAAALKKPAVRAKIEQLVQEKRDEISGLRTRVLEELCAIGFSRHNDYVQGDDGTITLNGEPLEGAKGKAHAAVKSIKRRTHYERDPDSSDPNALRAVHEVEFQLWDKNTALRNIGVHLGMFIERSAAATSPEITEGEGTVWDFGGKKITF